MLFTKNSLCVCILIHEIWFTDSLVGPILLIMQWSALENFKLADLHSLTISIKSNSVDWQEEEDRVGGGQKTPSRSFDSGKIIEVTRDSGKESSWIVVMEALKPWLKFLGRWPLDITLLRTCYARKTLWGKTMATLFLSPPNIQFSTSGCLYIGFSERCFWGNTWQGDAVHGTG